MENQYVQLQNEGAVVTSNTLSVTTACKMNLHQFPFDIQSCTFTLQSPIHSSIKTQKSMSIRVGQNSKLKLNQSHSQDIDRTGRGIFKRSKTSSVWTKYAYWCTTLMLANMTFKDPISPVVVLILSYCNIYWSFVSCLSGKELVISPFSDASFLTLSSKKAFQTQGEWELLSINMSKANVTTIGESQNQLIYKVQSRKIAIR